MFRAGSVAQRPQGRPPTRSGCVAKRSTSSEDVPPKRGTQSRTSGGVISRVLSPRPVCETHQRRGGSHSSGRPVARRAQAANPDLSARNTPAFRHEAPIWPCSGWGLPCGPCCQRPGALLPHPFTLACDLSVHRRYTLCGTFPELGPESPRPAGVTRHPRFVEPGLSSQVRRPTRLPRPPDTRASIPQR